MSAIIEVKNLTKDFREIKAVNDLSFTVQTGQVYGFLGQNGAGKSTTIRMLLTLIAPTSGSIEIFGMNLLHHRKEILRQVGAIIERPDLYKYLTALENLKLFAAMSGIKLTEKKLTDQLDRVGLADRAKSKVKTYSQGMKQRLGIAVALVHDPQLIILDEPTNGLDPQGIADIRNLILHLSRDQKKTLVVSSHLLHEMEMISDSMLIIDKGKKIVEGEAASLMDPAKTIVQVQTRDNAGALQLLKQTKWAAFIQPHEKELRLQMDKKNVPALNADLVSRGIEVLSISTKHSLEDYFLSITTPAAHVEAFTN
jgi:ABC-type multidrug transport system ATPase subunit